MVDRVLAVKLLPNLALPAGDDELDDDEAAGNSLGIEFPAALPETDCREFACKLLVPEAMFGAPLLPLAGCASGVWTELNLRRPANNCLLVFLVVDVVGRRVVELLDGAGVVLVVEVVDRAAVAESLV